jgi:hypothetical protein
VRTRAIRAAATAVSLSLLAGAVVLASTGTTGGPGRPVRALGPNGDGPVGIAEGSGGAKARVVVGETAAPHRTRSLASLPKGEIATVPWVKRELRLEPAEGEGGEAPTAPPSAVGETQADAELQVGRGVVQIPPASLNIAGLGSAVNPFNVVPPDPTGDVGAGFYVQAVNVAFAIYDADTGAKLAGPRLVSDFFAINGQKLCATHDDGDPIVLYDEYADRWLISQFALNFADPRFAECIAVSETADPTGAWNAYQFLYPNQNVINDYPKLGVWPATNNSGYFASFNQFRCSRTICDFAWRGAGAVAYERDAMLAGIQADQLYVNLYPVDDNAFGQLPSDADGAMPPSANTPNVFLQADADEWGYENDRLEVWEFDVDWGTHSATFDGPTLLPTANFNPAVCGFTRARVMRMRCVPQRGTKNKVDALNDRLMFRLQYRKLGASDERLVVSHTVRAAKGQAGLRWYELQDDGGGWTIANQGTYRPDEKSRWMGSVAMDAAGNIAAGYSISSSKTFPSIAIAGRTAGAPADTFDLAERKVFTGLGSEAPTRTTRYGRWGDYSDLTVSEDGCSFYFTTQYYRKTGQWKWGTRIVRFELPGCV